MRESTSCVGFLNLRGVEIFKEEDDVNSSTYLVKVPLDPNLGYHGRYLLLNMGDD